MEQIEIVEPFDEAARRRFGQWISSSRLKSQSVPCDHRDYDPDQAAKGAKLS